MRWLALIGLVVLLSGVVIAAVSGLPTSPLSTMITDGTNCVTFTVTNPGVSGPGTTPPPSPTLWATGNPQVLSINTLFQSGCTLDGAYPTPAQIFICQTISCSAAQTPFAGGPTLFGSFGWAGVSSVNNWLNYTWPSVSATINGISVTGTNNYAAGTTFLVFWGIVVISSSAQTTAGCSSAPNIGANVYVCTTQSTHTSLTCCWGQFASGISGSAFDFTMSATSIAGFGVTGTGTSTITINPLNGYPGPTAFTAACSSTSVTCNVSPTTGSGTTGTTLTVGTSCCSGSYTATVTGTYSSPQGNIIHSVIVPFTVSNGGGGGSTVADFSLSAPQTGQSFPVGGTGTVTLTVSGLNGFTGTVTLAATTQINTVGGSCSVLPTSIALSSSTVSGTFTVSLAATSAGSFTCNINGSSGTLSHTLSILGSFTGSQSVANALFSGGQNPLAGQSWVLPLGITLMIAGAVILGADFYVRKK